MHGLLLKGKIEMFVFMAGADCFKTLINLDFCAKGFTQPDFISVVQVL